MLVNLAITLAAVVSCGLGTWIVCSWMNTGRSRK